MANKPRKGGGGSSSGGGGGGGFLQGLFGPQANADFGKEQGEAAFDNPTPTEQPYQSPSLWQRFLAPEQSRAAEAANIGAVRDNMLLTKDQAFRVAQEQAREKAALEMEKLRLSGSLNNQLTLQSDEQRFASERAVQQEEAARRAALFQQELATKELLRNQAALGQGFLDAGITNTNIAGLQGLGGAKYTPEMLVRLALAEKLKGGEAMQQGGTAVENSRRDSANALNLLTKAKAEQELPYVGDNARSNMMLHKGQARNANMLFNPAFEFSDTGSVLRSLVPPSVETDIVEGHPRKFGDITLPGLPTKVRTVHPGQVDGIVVGGVSAKKPVAKISLDTPTAASPGVQTKSPAAVAESAWQRMRENLGQFSAEDVNVPDFSNSPLLQELATKKIKPEYLYPALLYNQLLTKGWDKVGSYLNRANPFTR